MRTDEVLISAIIPVFNGEKFLEEAVESIRRQAYQPIEIIIVDDGSTDGTARLVQEIQPAIRYIYQDNRGPAAARNRGLKEAHGEIIAFLDADDLWPPNKLRLQLSQLQANPKTEVILGQVQWVRLADEMQGIREDHYEEKFYASNLGSALFRRSVFERIGIFDPELRYSEDVDWFARAREQGVNMFLIPEVTLYYRKHSANMTRNKNAQDLNVLRVLKRSLDRRRAQGGGHVERLAPLNITNKDADKPVETLPEEEEVKQ
jgi:glycosyltransferase involved in cell wall biosynthesis